MKKQTLLAVSLLMLTGIVSAQAVVTNDDVGRRNGLINRHCAGIVQAKYNYSKLAPGEKASKDREHSTEIEKCYRSFKLSVAIPSPQLN